MERRSHLGVTHGTGWWRDAVIYEIYMKSFQDSDGDGIGDIEGVIRRLPYLKELGVDCIWFTPIYPSPQFDNGYDVADYYGIEECYGGMEAFRRLLAKAHSMGIRIIMDMVLNHSSDECRWFTEAKKGKDNPYRDYYIWRDPKPDGSEPNNWANKFLAGNGSAWTFDENSGQYYLGNYAPKMPELNWEYEGLRKEVYQMMQGWFELGIDGFRLDVITRLKKPAGLPDSKKEPNSYGYCLDPGLCSGVPGLHEIIKDMAQNTWLLPGYDVFSVGEAGAVRYDNAVEYLAPERGELDMVYHFQIVSRNHAKVSVPEFKKIQQGWADLAEKGIRPTQLLENHDQPRSVSRFGDDKNYRIRSAKALALVNCLLPGMLILYQGQEIGMVNTYFDSIDDYNDRYTVGDYYERRNRGLSHEEALFPLRELSRDNARRPMLWDETENAGFTTGTPWISPDPNYKELNVRKDLAAEDSICLFYRQVLRLRKESPAMYDGIFKLFLPEHEQLIVFRLWNEKEELLVAANASSAEAELVPDEGLKDALKEEGTWNPILSSLTPAGQTPENRELTGRYRPWEAIVLQKIKA